MKKVYGEPVITVFLSDEKDIIWTSNFVDYTEFCDEPFAELNY